MKVKVYFNLHKKLFSIVAMEGEEKGLVIGHTDYIELANPEFRVQQKGRDKVLREKRKNVHAYVTGYSCKLKPDNELSFEWLSASYNPYKYKTFILNSTGSPVFNGMYAKLYVDNESGKILVDESSKYISLSDIPKLVNLGII